MTSPIQPGQVLRHFRVEAMLGRGGMGVVYRAEDLRLGRTVALKLLAPELTGDPVGLARLEREARMLAALNHPHIAGIHSFEHLDDARFLVLEFVDGQTLADRLANGRIPLGESLRIAHGIAAGLEAAHRRGILHRDLKPANVMTTREGTPKILDLGLAKPFAMSAAEGPTSASDPTGHGGLVGTIAYMSPEHLRGHTLDPRSDVWSFGCMLFELVCGRRPFHAETAVDTISAILVSEPDWTALPSDTPEALGSLLRRMLDRDAVARPADAGVVRAALAGVLEQPLPGTANSAAPHALPRGTSPAADSSSGTSERRLVTALAIEILGLSALSDSLGHELASRAMVDLVAAIERAAAVYDGRAVSRGGGQVTALFGLTAVQEDDPARAVRTALDVQAALAEVLTSVPQPLRRDVVLRAGVAAAHVVVPRRELNDASLAAVLASEAVASAADLCSAAQPGEVLATEAAAGRAGTHVVFGDRRPVASRGGTAALVARPATGRRSAARLRPRARRARLVGRDAERLQLEQTGQRVGQGHGALVALVGDAGTGKSRLIDDFAAWASAQHLGWREGHAYPYSQAVPYALVRDLLDRAWGIERADVHDEVRRKIERGVREAFADPEAVLPVLAPLFALRNVEGPREDPEAWKGRLQSTFSAILDGWARQGPCVVCLEDLHWADVASLDVLRPALAGNRSSVLVLVSTRTQVGALPGVASSMSPWVEIPLGQLSRSETGEMVASLLDSGPLSPALQAEIASTAGGNPLFVEEIVQALVESGVLAHGPDGWTLTRRIDTVAIPSTIEDVVMARVDRLDPEWRRTLQEAAVIGRVFPLQVLRAVTTTPATLDGRLSDLARLGLVEAAGDRERYRFSHVLIQEAIYASVAPAERRQMHDRVAREEERLYRGREEEYSETLAYHYSRGVSPVRAVDYLRLSGEKCWERRALAEADTFFRQAFALLDGADSTEGSDERRIDLLNRWASVFNHRGDFRAMVDLFEANEPMAGRLPYARPRALFYGWLGYALQCRERLRPSYEHLQHALAVGDQTRDEHVIAYSSAWLARTCVDLGRFAEALALARRAESLLADDPPDTRLIRFTYSAMGLAHYFMGDVPATDRVAGVLMEAGERHADIGCTTLGLIMAGSARLTAGDFDRAVDTFSQAVRVSVYPMFTHYAKLMVGLAQASSGAVDEARDALDEVIRFQDQSGFDLVGTTARGVSSLAHLAHGDLGPGLQQAREVLDAYTASGAAYRRALQLHLVGSVYLRIALREGPRTLGYLVRNIGFLFSTLPKAKRLAEEMLSEAARSAQDLGARGIEAQASLGLGRLHLAAGRTDEARRLLAHAERLFAETGAAAWHARAREHLVGTGA